MEATTMSRATCMAICAVFDELVMRCLDQWAGAKEFRLLVSTLDGPVIIP
jgi:hypothetical protein